MKLPILPILLIAAAACSGASTIVTPPPPPPSSTPAAVVVQSGGGQQGEPGAVLATRPSVLVTDASGTPVSGASVTFAVDSGGGSLSVSTVKTGANGVATAGTWTLGSAEGRNVLKVTVGALPPIRIVALAQITGGTLPTMTVGTGGGQMSVAQSGPLNGFSLVIPAGAFTASLQATISYASSTTIPASSVSVPVSPLITISTTLTDYATKPLTIHIAATIPAGSFPAIVIYDPSTGAKEVLTTIAWDANGVTSLITT
ncbi:MAG: Ig-like domain-containing protein, partial [Gemmatimonadales bacterium]